MNNLVTIGPISTSIRDGRFRVQADVLGETLWFESADAPLAASPEAFASALLMPTLAKRCNLHVSDPVCPIWNSQIPQVENLLRRWWNYPVHIPWTRTTARAKTQPNSNVGLLFTGGADSFFSLLHSTQKIQSLIYVLDYDVPPQAPTRFSNFEPHLRTIADELKLQAILVRSNLRRHAAFHGPPWQETHGAALIAVGHLLRDTIGTLIVSSSHPRSAPENWGTHWDLDPLWSSAYLTVVHFGEETRRSEKIRMIVDDSLAQCFLRPCWENPPGGLNCSVCEKCVRTQLVVTRWGDLDKFSAFDHSQSLAERLNGIKRIPRANRLLSYTDCQNAQLPPGCHEALAKLIRRSHRYFLRKKITRSVARVIWPKALWRKPRAA